MMTARPAIMPFPALMALPRVAAALLLASVSTSALAAPSRSVYATAPSDPRAITVVARGDGVTDDGPAIQRAIDAAAATTEGSGAGGLVFLPAGRYRITRTLYLRPGVRLFGVGKTRPVLVLASATPGFQRGVGSMVMFTGNLPPPPGARAAPPVAVPPPTSVPFAPDCRPDNGVRSSRPGNCRPRRARRSTRRPRPAPCRSARTGHWFERNR